MYELVELIFFQFSFFTYKPLLILLIFGFMFVSYSLTLNKTIRILYLISSLVWLAFAVNDFFTPINAIRADLILWLPLIGTTFYFWIASVLFYLIKLSVKNRT